MRNNNPGHNHLCTSCEYFVEDKSLGGNPMDLTAPKMGRCMRHPPVTTLQPVRQGNQTGMGIQTSFPVVNVNMWCYDHDQLVKERLMDDIKNVLGMDLQELINLAAKQLGMPVKSEGDQS